MKIAIAKARQYGTRILMAQGVPGDIAEDVAEHLVESDRVGHTSHGLSILPRYHEVISSGLASVDGRPELLSDRGTLLIYDGHNGLGQHVGKMAVSQAIERTRENSHCILTLRRSHHLGRMGHYGEMVAAEGMIMISFTNVINLAPMVAPYGGARPCLATNPFCFAWPLPDNRPPFLVDMATSSLAMNKVRVMAANGKETVPGSLIDAQGKPTTDPNVLFTDPPGSLLSFGGHKGYAIGLMVELLAGVLSGGGIIQPESPRDGMVTNNMFALLINPQVDFNTDGNFGEVSAFIDYLKACPTQPGVDCVQYPGEYEAANRDRNKESITFYKPIWESLVTLGKKLGVSL